MNAAEMMNETVLVFDGQTVKEKVRVDHVLVCLGEPPGGNPRLGALVGPARRLALGGLRNGTVVGFTLWHAPSGGEVRRLRAADVAWEF